ncbi:RseA family anti-sigma factor [Herbaspirillum sp. RTI4]|uniref:sigma-E factor negative regulatory protein n=1 Tax=Herbaspirillum sp. RTI4 TaxID=3048640 RepID=UPI002AB57648|nr:RseA family anti-sigma factor [Herbaspirillum sp. RTI4]MDY7578495.1 RseA family anti-sigma factor [Herbaspirillum sp. RTI4]MEA9981476.1 RseA family anti-sigma factor [Herbaspirillum sp. RTI4]
MNSTDIKMQISALVDSEQLENSMHVSLAGLHNPDARAAWDVYHQIGDVLRSDDMAFSFSDKFSARMWGLLEAEPTYITLKDSIATATHLNSTSVSGNNQSSRMTRRIAGSGVVTVIAVAALIFMVKPESSLHPVLTQVMLPASATNPVWPTVSATPSNKSLFLTADKLSADNEGLPGLASLAQQGDVVRDPRIDNYLLAHQRFAPHPNNSTEYARTAVFAVDSKK